MPPQPLLTSALPLWREPWILRSEGQVWTSNRGCTQSNFCSSSCSPGPDEWIFFLCAVGALPIEMSEKLFQGFITLCLVPCAKLQVACFSWPLWTKPFMCVTARGNRRAPWFGAVFVRSVPKAAPPVAPLPVREGAGAAEVCKVTWRMQVQARGSHAGSLVHILQWDPALLVPL